jgi:myosin heavy subunit
VPKKVERIQASGRGYMQRFRETRLLFETDPARAEQIRQRQAEKELERRRQAAVTIQAAARGHLSRLALLVLRLEHQLAKLEAYRLQELREIYQWKSLEMAKIRDEVEAVHARERDHEASKLECIKRLRAQNQRLHNSNKMIRQDCDDLDELNRRLSRELESTEDEIQRLRDDQARIERSNEQWTNINQMYADQVDKYGPAMDELDEMTAVEKHKNSLIQRTMVQVLEKVELADNRKIAEPPDAETTASSLPSSSNVPSPVPSLFHIALTMAAEAPWSRLYGDLPRLALRLAGQQDQGHSLPLLPPPVD